MIRSIHRLLTGMVLVLLVLSGVPRAQTGSLRGNRIHVAVVKSGSLPQYDKACGGFLEALRDSGLNVDTTVHVLRGATADAAAIVSGLHDDGVDLILTLGTKAAKHVAIHETELPIVYSMVFNTSASSRATGPVSHQPNVIGTNLNIPPETQLQEMLRLFPWVKRVGIISNPEISQPLVRESSRLLGAYGLDLETAWAPRQEDIPDAVRTLIGDEIDILWMVPDKTIFTPQSSRYIIFELLKAGVPFMGLSSAYVKAGAVMALDCDYVDVGRQSGELAIRVLRGETPGNIPVPNPRLFHVALNTRVTEQLEIKIAPELIADPRIVKF